MSSISRGLRGCRPLRSAMRLIRRSARRRALVDAAVTASAHWRSECAAVRGAYHWWSQDSASWPMARSSVHKPIGAVCLRRTQLPRFGGCRGSCRALIELRPVHAREGQMPASSRPGSTVWGRADSAAVKRRSNFGRSAGETLSTRTGLPRRKLLARMAVTEHRLLEGDVAR